MPPFFRIVLRDDGCVHQHGRQVAEVPAPFFMNRAIPMMMVAEWARTSVISTLTMEAREAVIALDCVGLHTRRRGTDSLVADAGKVLIVRCHIILKASAINDVVHNRFAFSLFVFGT